ncbi:MAG: hypothetical protein QOE77_914 [Blastocatellia bacterium]|jgi:hypothetical protein|nr:hypothetical protein [Blastocatellia bacterium]
MKQTVLSFITEVTPGRAAELDALLKHLQEDLLHNPSPALGFPSLKQLHFASLLVHEDQGYPAILIFESNFDGEVQPFLNDLLQIAGPALNQIYGHCAGYVEQTSGDPAPLRNYLRDHIVEPNAYYIGNVGRSVARTLQENGLRDSAEKFLDDLVHLGQSDVPPQTLRQKMQKFVRDSPALAWVANVPARQTAGQKILPWVHIVIVALVTIALLPILIGPFIIYLIILRWKETHDIPQTTPANKEHEKALLETELRPNSVQTHMSSITIVKPGAFRRCTLRTVLFLIELAARVSVKGNLFGIATIHFAHWSLIDQGRRLVFLSNFDGSWENYLDDFIDKVSAGLTGVWSNTTGFPKTKFLFFEGTRNGPRFKATTRDKQTPTTIWYSAYPHLTVQNVDNNSAIREGFFKNLNEQQSRTWLWRF